MASFGFHLHKIDLIVSLEGAVRAAIARGCLGRLQRWFTRQSWLGGRFALSFFSPSSRCTVHVTEQRVSSAARGRRGPEPALSSASRAARTGGGRQRFVTRRRLCHLREPRSEESSSVPAAARAVGAAGGRGAAGGPGTRAGAHPLPQRCSPSSPGIVVFIAWLLVCRVVLLWERGCKELG